MTYRIDTAAALREAMAQAGNIKQYALELRIREIFPERIHKLPCRQTISGILNGRHKVRPITWSLIRAALPGLPELQ